MTDSIYLMKGDKMTGEKPFTSAIAPIIKGRRAVKTGYTDQYVEEALVLDLLNIAAWAPTHGMRQPWRFVFVDKHSLPQFAKQVAATYPDNMQQNREDYLNEPNAILVVLMEEPEMKKQWDENFGATASLIQNFWLLAWERKLGVVWKTNPHIYNEKVAAIVGANANERIVGFLHLGYFDKEPEIKERISIDEKFSRYTK